MKVKFIFMIFLSLISCSTLELSDKIYKSQVKYYKEQKVDMKEMNHLNFLNEARKGVFKELEAYNCENHSSSKLFFIEGYDFSNLKLHAAIIIDNKVYYYEGSNLTKFYSLADDPTIEEYIIQSYINNDYSKLKDTLIFKSISYIGTSVNFEKRTEIKHFGW